MQSSPSLAVYCGPMFSGKTTALLSSVERFKLQGRRVIVFKPEIDDRYASTEVVSHLGWQHSAETVSSGTGIIGALSRSDLPPDVVALDETFMVPGSAEALVWLYRTGISVVASTLDLSSTGKPFREVELLLPHATIVKKFVAVCTVCGRDAPYTHKKLASTEETEIEVGGDEMYEPRCGFHHPFVMNHDVLSVRYSRGA